MHGVEGHGAGGQGAGLVQAQDIHPGQYLNGSKLLDQDHVAGKPDPAHRKSHAGEQDQAKGNH